MRKIFSMAAALLLSMGCLMAQNTFKGIVKYEVKSTGQVAMEIPAESATAEIKVSGEDMMTKSSIFMSSPFTEHVLVNGLTMTSCENYGQLLSYLRSQGSEFTYQGEGKLLLKNKFKPEAFDSLEIKDTEPGHFYYEYTTEKKEIAGVQATKLIQHRFDDEGVDHPKDMWVCETMGPKVNVLFGGIKGMPIQCSIEAGEGREITYTAIEVKEGKVKEADFLLPFGYEELSEEDLETLGQELQDEMELLRAE